MTSYRLHIRAVPDNTNPVDINEKNDCAFVKFGTGKQAIDTTNDVTYVYVRTYVFM